jgi:DNA-binding NtrC family response regulator
MKKRVLVVDDDTAVRESLKRVLQTAGYEVGMAADAEEATLKFVPEQTDLLVLDLNLPSQSGWEVFERLTTRYPLVPVIIITGMPHQYETAVAAGAGALMEKPIEATSLLNTIDELLAEPQEAQLRRICGYQHDTKHLQSPNAGSAGKRHTSAINPVRRRQTQEEPRWNAE